ncbi:MAG: hypothetical protein EI684_10825 [Candidatus Viridilinea halotolerans]|uniref:Uncharacterized protein n=1 Tax=Candidatus Viridilinea halotolerans TaxID=2491704 RepID=A0A426TZV3_9CHLR|nr:MAG: hypothetical protein EI684_10825 [Candidatus Viridilinea halotolerans]
MKKPSKRAMRDFLQNQTHAQLLELLLLLAEKQDGIRECIGAQMGLGFNEELLAHHRTLIERAMFPSGRQLDDPHLASAQQAIKAYQQISTNHAGVADLMLYYVELGINYAEQCSSHRASFGRNLTRMYLTAVKHIVRHDMQSLFRERCEEIVTDASEIPLYFYEDMVIAYDENFVLDSDDEED